MSKKILIVEDEEGLLDGLAHNFRYEGYEVLTAKNGQEGLKLALKQKPDAVLLDIMLPEKDGFTVLKELRQRHRDIPVLVMTARNFEADVLKGFDLGADDYVTKPFGIKELMARVKRLVARGPLDAGSPARRSTSSATSRCVSSRARWTRPAARSPCRSRNSSCSST